MNWTQEIPTVSGHYWLYRGKRPKGEWDGPSLVYVGPNNPYDLSCTELVYGEFNSKVTDAGGYWWLKIEIPEVPKE